MSNMKKQQDKWYQRSDQSPIGNFFSIVCIIAGTMAMIVASGGAYWHFATMFIMYFLSYITFKYW